MESDPREEEYLVLRRSQDVVEEHDEYQLECWSSVGVISIFQNFRAELSQESRRRECRSHCSSSGWGAGCKRCRETKGVKRRGRSSRRVVCKQGTKACNSPIGCETRDRSRPSNSKVDSR